MHLDLGTIALPVDPHPRDREMAVARRVLCAGGLPNLHRRAMRRRRRTARALERATRLERRSELERAARARRRRAAGETR